MWWVAGGVLILGGAGYLVYKAATATSHHQAQEAAKEEGLHSADPADAGVPQ